MNKKISIPIFIIVLTIIIAMVIVNTKSKTINNKVNTDTTRESSEINMGNHKDSFVPAENEKETAYNDKYSSSYIYGSNELNSLILNMNNELKNFNVEIKNASIKHYSLYCDEIMIDTNVDSKYPSSGGIYYDEETNQIVLSITIQLKDNSEHNLTYVLTDAQYNSIIGGN